MIYIYYSFIFIKINGFICVNCWRLEVRIWYCCNGNMVRDVGMLDFRYVDYMFFLGIVNLVRDI